MSSPALKTWLKSKLKALPAIPFYAKRAQELITNENFEKIELSKIISADPGLSSQLFNLVNAKRKGTKREYIESILSALSLMGDAGIINFIKNISTFDDIRTSFDCENDYLELIARAQQAARHAKLWAEKRHSQGIKEIGSATRLYDIAEFAFCLFDHEKYQSYKVNNHTEYNPKKYSQALLGFDINQLSLALCDHFHLPELVREAHDPNEVLGIRSQGIYIASELMHQADLDWYSTTTISYLKKAADLCQAPIDTITTMAHITCVESAQELDFNVKFHSAANLVRHQAPPRPTHIKVVKPKKATTEIKTPIKESPLPQQVTPPSGNELLLELKIMAKNSTTSQANLLNTLLEGCQNHIKTHRNALFLLSKDHKKISTRLHKGLSKGSALLNFSMPMQQSGLLKILLEKPQAIWINSNNYRKYEKMLPGIFKSCSLSDDFFMMSLFSGGKAVGIVFCDNYGQKIPLNKEQFNLFKQAVSLTAKAMLLISQRHKLKAKS